MCVSVRQHRDLTNARGDDPLIVVRVDTHGVTLEVEGKLAVLDMLQLVLVEVRPPPDPSVDHVREPLTPRHLRTPTDNISGSQNTTKKH